MMGFANDPHGFIVKAINVEPGTGVATTTDPNNPVQSLSTPYGPGPYTPGGYAPSGYPPGVAPAATPTPTRGGGLPTVLDEKQLRVTLVLNVVRLHSKH
jgi:hypothetical protein